jgi:cation diffusion facilitator family transporter
MVNNQSRQEAQSIAIKVSIYGSGLLFLIIAAVGVVSDSVTLLLDAATNFVIFAVALLTNASLKKVHRPPDHKYNFGYTKFEPFTVVIQAALIIMLCLVSAGFALQDLLNPEDIKGYVLPVAVEILSGLLAIVITWYLASVGRKTDSAMLKGSAMQWKMETVLSFGIAAGFFVGMVLRAKGYTHITPYVDPSMALILAIALVYEPIMTMRHAVPELLDAAPSDSIQTTVRSIVDKYKPHSFGVSRLRARKAGRKVFVDVCFLVKGETTVVETAKLADNFQRDVEDHLPDSDVLVHFSHKH